MSSPSTEYYHPSSIPTEIDVPRPGYLLDDAQAYLGRLRVDLNSPECTRGENSEEVSRHTYEKIAPDGIGHLKCCDWRRINKKGDTTFGGEGVYEGARTGTTPETWGYEYRLNKKGQGMITAGGMVRILETQPPSQSAMEGRTAVTAAAITLPTPLCRVIPIELGRQDCFTAQGLGDDGSGQGRSHEYDIEGREGTQYRSARGREHGEYQALDGLPTRWTAFRNGHHEQLSLIKKPGIQFVVPSHSRFVSSTTGYVDL
jgi:hypothetical protein